MTRDYLKLFHLENYLLGDVAEKFRANGRLDAFDFFCIVIWKSNRAKSRVADRFLTKNPDLGKAVEDLTVALAQERDRKAKMKLLISGWGFNLPMASAILTILFGNDFTVYDYRVCDQVGGFHETQNLTFEKMWPEYEEYIAAVDKAAPQAYERRDKDRWLWGKSFSEQLEKDVATGFKNVLREAAVCWIRNRLIGDRFTYNDIYRYLETTFPDECSSRGQSNYREDAKRAVKDDAIKQYKLVKKTDRLQFERIMQEESNTVAPFPLAG